MNKQDFERAMKALDTETPEDKAKRIEFEKAWELELARTKQKDLTPLAQGLQNQRNNRILTD